MLSGLYELGIVLPPVWDLYDAMKKPIKQFITRYIYKVYPQYVSSCVTPDY